MPVQVIMPKILQLRCISSSLWNMRNLKVLLGLFWWHNHLWFLGHFSYSCEGDLSIICTFDHFFSFGGSSIAWKIKSKLHGNIHMVFVSLLQLLLTGLPPWILHSLPIHPCALPPLCSIMHPIVCTRPVTVHTYILYCTSICPCSLHRAFYVVYPLNFTLFPMVSQNFSCFIPYA